MLNESSPGHCSLNYCMICKPTRHIPAPSKPSDFLRPLFHMFLRPPLWLHWRAPAKSKEMRPLLMPFIQNLHYWKLGSKFTQLLWRTCLLCLHWHFFLSVQANSVDLELCQPFKNPNCLLFWAEAVFWACVQWHSYQPVMFFSCVTSTCLKTRN